MNQEDIDSHLTTLKRRRKKGTIIGILVMFSALPLLVILAIFQPLDPPIASMIFALMFVLPMCGLVYLFLVGVTAKYFLQAVSIFQQIELDQLVITPKYILAQKDDVYLFTPQRTMAIYFIRFKVILETSRKEIQIPKIRWTWQMKDEIGGLKVAKREQKCAIPISPEMYGTGDALIYYLDVQTNRGLFGELIDRKHLKSVRSMTRDSSLLLMVINQLQEAF